MKHLKQMRLTSAQRRRRANKMSGENFATQSGRQAVGSWLKNKGTAIGVAIGVALTSLGDYLLGDTGLIPFCIGLVKQAIAFF